MLTIRVFLRPGMFNINLRVPGEFDQFLFFKKKKTYYWNQFFFYRFFALAFINAENIVFKPPTLTNVVHPSGLSVNPTANIFNAGTFKCFFCFTHSNSNLIVFDSAQHEKKKNSTTIFVFLKQLTSWVRLKNLLLLFPLPIQLSEF